MTNPFIAKEIERNPFVLKAAKRKMQARDTMRGHVAELAGLLDRMDPGEARERVAARLEEARAGARAYE